MRNLTLTFIDEVNARLDGLSSKEIAAIREKTKIFDKSARNSIAYELGHDDGYRYFFDEEGFFFQYLIPQVIDVLVGMGVDVDSMTVEDERLPDRINEVTPVGDDFLIEEIGFTLREHQRTAINAAIQGRRGIIDHGTSAGKSATTLGISKALDGLIKVIVVVPSDLLSRQTFEYYEKSNLKAARLHAGVKASKRQQVFEDHNHIIITNKLLLNCLDFIQGGQYALLIDEIHSYFGEQFSDALRFELGNCPIRIGLTGSIPKDKYKAMRIFCHLGDKSIDIVKAKTLIANKQASTLNIQMIQTIHPEIADLSTTSEWKWDVEKKYTDGNLIRLHAIADFIKSLPNKNTLILGHAAAMKILCTHFDGRVIVDETPTNDRNEIISQFDTENDAKVIGTWGTIATGVSKNRIFQIVLVDVGKNFTAIVQSIGRGIRLDGDVNHLDVYDIYADTKYALKHKKERVSIYKAESYPYQESDITIRIEE